MTTADAIPVIDIAPLAGGVSRAAADAIGRACRDFGFFYVRGHGVAPALLDRLESQSRRFFALAPERKAEIAMARGGRAWRGYFPLGAELTSGCPDQKEGLYFGAELGPDHPKVRAGAPLHGANLFPSERDVEGFRATVLEYLDAMTALGHRLMRGLSLSLSLDPEHLARHYTADPLILFRIFHYPPLEADSAAWSVGEHTDYGALTILLQDRCGGLQVRSGSRWIDAPPIPGTFVCNIGDMLDRLSSGRYRSTPHRVRNASGRARLSFPFFFDPGFDTEVRAIDPSLPISDDARSRWDRQSVHEFEGTYGEYLLQKVAKVFPGLRDEVL